jgi:threonine dehydrogenase-like Zn-dependent dehydrogenase
VIDAVGMEAHGSPIGHLAHQMASLLPDTVAEKLMTTAGVDRLAALYTAIEVVRRGGTISLSGVYGGMASPMPLLRMLLDQAPQAYATFQNKQDGMIKTLLQPHTA